MLGVGEVLVRGFAEQVNVTTGTATVEYGAGFLEGLEARKHSHGRIVSSSASSTTSATITQFCLVSVRKVAIEFVSVSAAEIGEEVVTSPLHCSVHATCTCTCTCATTPATGGCLLIFVKEVEVGCRRGRGCTTACDAHLKAVYVIVTVTTVISETHLKRRRRRRRQRR